MDTIKDASTLAENVIIIRAVRRIHALKPDPIKGQHWKSEPRNTQTRAVVTIVYKQELNLLRLQARSMRQYIDGSELDAIYVIINDPDFEGCVGFFERVILPEYGDLRSKLILMHREELSKGGYHVNGWRSQQFLKLLAARVIGEDQLVIFDAKNHLISPMLKTLTISHNGASITYASDRTNDFRRHFEKTYEYFGLNPDIYREFTLPTDTPFVVPRRLIVEALDLIEMKSGQPFVEYFLRDGEFMTEFMLISAYCQKQYGALMPVFAFGPMRYRLLSKTSVLESRVDACLREAASNLNIFSFAIHRSAIAELDASETAKIDTFLRSRNLLSANENASLFLKAP